MVTLFPTLKKVESPFYKEIDDVLLSFKNQTNFKQISAIRKENDENKKASLKKLLMPICFSGEFSYRSAKSSFCLKVAILFANSLLFLLLYLYQQLLDNFFLLNNQHVE